MSRRRTLALLPLVVGGLVACGGDDSSSGTDAATTAATTADTETTTSATTTTPSTETTETDATSGDDPQTTGDVAEFCGPMEDLANYNAETPLPDTGADWSAFQQEILDRADEALPLYDDAIDAAPDEVRPDLQTLRDYSDEFLGAVEEADSFEDLGAAIATPPDDVLTATAELEAYIQENCGFGLTEAG